MIHIRQQRPNQQDLLFWFNSWSDRWNQSTDFLVEAKQKIEYLEEMVANINTACQNLAIHFSEDPAIFNLAEFLGIFSDMIDNVNSCRKENEERKRQEERAAKRAAQTVSDEGRKTERTQKPS